MEKFYIKFSAGNNITCDYICNIVQKIVNSNNDLENKVLVLELKTINNHGGDSPIPKITFKN